MSLAERELSENLLGKPYEALTPIQKSIVDLVVSEAPKQVATLSDRMAK